MTSQGVVGRSVHRTGQPTVTQPGVPQGDSCRLRVPAQIRIIGDDTVRSTLAVQIGGYVRGLPSASRLRSVIRVSASGHARQHDEHPRSRARPAGRVPARTRGEPRWRAPGGPRRTSSRHDRTPGNAADACEALAVEVLHVAGNEPGKPGLHVLHCRTCTEDGCS